MPLFTSLTLIPSALAQDAAGAPPQPSLGSSLIPIVLVVLVFYLLIYRPQKKRVDQHKEMVSSLKRGDRVVTAGGIIGKITKIEEGDSIEVEIAPDVRVQVIKSTVSEVTQRSGGKQEESQSPGKNKKNFGKKA